MGEATGTATRDGGDLDPWLEISLSSADPFAQAWVRERLTQHGLIGDGQGETHALGAELASAVLAQACLLLDWAADVTGLPTPTRTAAPHG